jgi:hypothetical protein
MGVRKPSLPVQDVMRINFVIINTQSELNKTHRTHIKTFKEIYFIQKISVLNGACGMEAYLRLCAAFFLQWVEPSLKEFYQIPE